MIDNMLNVCCNRYCIFNKNCKTFNLREEVYHVKIYESIS